MKTRRRTSSLFVALALLVLLAPSCDGDPSPVESQTETSDKVVVPALSGRDVDEAENLLEAEGLRAEVDRQVFPNAEPRTVVDSEPNEGTLVDGGTVVRITIATRR